MTVSVGINGFGRIGRQSLKAIIERAPDVEVVAVNDLVDTAMNALLFKHDSTYGAYAGTVDHTDDALVIDGREIKVLQVKDPAQLPWRDMGVDIVLESTGLFTDADEGRRPHRRRRPQGDHQRARQERGRDHRPGRQRGRLRPREAPHHQQRQLHHQLPGARRQGRPRRLDHPARPDEHDPLVHQRPAHPGRGPQGSAPRARRRPEHHPHHDRRGQGARPRHPRPEGQVRRLQPARADADRQRRRLHRRAGAPGHRRGAQRRLPRRRGRPHEGHPRRQRRAARLDRLPRRHALVDHRRRVDDVARRDLREGHRLVRQRVGLQLPRRGPRSPSSALGSTSLPPRHGPDRDGEAHRPRR